MLHYAQGVAASPPALYKFIVGGALRLPFYLGRRPLLIPSFHSWIALVPAICILGKSRALHAYDAEPLPGRSLHHHPPLQAVDDTGTQSFQASDFSRDVIRFDVDVNPAFVADALKLHDRFVGWRFQHAVIAAATGMIGIYRTAQCLGPEARGLIDISYVAVDQQCAKSRVVHDFYFQTSDGDWNQLIYHAALASTTSVLGMLSCQPRSARQEKASNGMNLQNVLPTT